MRYLGGKSLIAKTIVAQMPSPDAVRNVYEPFCGGGAVTVALAQKYSTVQASDIHEDLICMWRSLQDGWTPPTEVSEELYQHWRYTEPTTQEEAALKAFLGYGGSFGGRYFEGFARGGFTADGTHRNHQQESRRRVLSDVQQMYNVTFRSGDYEVLVRAKPGDLVYCDPPYKDTKSYSRIERFDYERFWGWANHLAETGVSVYVSELQAPDGWEPIWSKSQNRSVKRQGDVTTTESLFTK